MIRRQGPIKVMIVDDLPIAAEALSLALSSSKRDTRFALSGVEAVHQSTDRTPDVIILDINMDEHDGYQTAHVLRRLTMTRNAVLIAFPALSEADVTRKAIAAGFDAYCQKGNSVPRLIRLIDGFIGEPAL
jgi:two-component system OmpR family response regulator